jgi:hypothetical protein
VRDEVDDSMIRALDNDLRVIRQRHRARLGEKRQVSNLAEVSKALAEIQDATSIIIGTLDEDVRTGTCSLEVTMAAFFPSAPDDFKAVRRLHQETEQVLEHIKQQKRLLFTRTPKIWLFVDLYDLYCEIKGRKRQGISADGPLYRFEKTCVGMIDEGLDFPNGNTFLGALRKTLVARRLKPISVTDRPQTV